MTDKNYSQSLVEAAAELGKPVEQVTPIDLLDYPHEDLPDGPESPLGSDDGSHHLQSRSESETRRLAAVGKKILGIED